MKHVHLFKALNDGMGSTETPNALIRHASRQQGQKNPAARPERQHQLANLFTVQEAF